jgi:hypothetical protein
MHFFIRPGHVHCAAEELLSSIGVACGCLWLENQVFDSPSGSACLRISLRPHLCMYMPLVAHVCVNFRADADILVRPCTCVYGRKVV